MPGQQPRSCMYSYMHSDENYILSKWSTGIMLTPEEKARKYRNRNQNAQMATRSLYQSSTTTPAMLSFCLAHTIFEYLTANFRPIERNR